MNNEWIFDNPSASKLQTMVQDSEPNLALNFDATKIKWKPFISNHAYGVKKYILNEETYLPSMGYCDARTRMYNPQTAKLLAPWKRRDVFHKKIRTFEETKHTVFNTEWVKTEMEKIVQ
jgi:hypothetical protein